MTTLKRIIKQVKDLGYPLTEEDYLRCFREWLQQKQIYTFEHAPYEGYEEYYNKKELLEELEL